VTAAGSTQWLWFVSRGSGLVLFVLLSIVVTLGIAARTGAAPRTWRRFTTAELHRSLALFAVAFLALHVVTAVLDPYVSIGWWATFVPFVSPYRTAALGAGALVVDLGAAVVASSLLRDRLGYRAWRLVHWAAYAAWPIALVHALKAGNDLAIGWVAVLVWGSAALVATAVVARVLDGLRPHAEAPAR